MFFLLTNISHLMSRLNRKLVVNWFKHLSCSSIYALERKQKLGFLLRVHITSETGSAPGALWWLILMGEHFDWKSSWLRFIWQFGAWFLSLVGADPVMMIAVTSVRESQGPPETFPTCMISVTWSIMMMKAASTNTFSITHSSCDSFLAAQDYLSFLKHSSIFLM